jgi:dTDP-4-amino-4,6-dideoxygalactose transaminase
MNIDPQQIEDAISPRTRALLPVHFAGRSCDMRSISAIAAKHGRTLGGGGLRARD